MLFRILLSILLLQTQTVLAQNKIWLRAYDASLEDFDVFLETSSRMSYAEFQLNYLRKQIQKFQIKEKLISAQKLYLGGKNEKAMRFFNQITKEAYSADWSKEEHRIILYAFLRSAQIQEEEEQAQALLILARNFNGRSLIEETYTDFNLFPPPLMKQLEKIQEKNSVLYPDWNTLFPNHEIILVNGQKVKKNKVTPLLAARYRVTALSSSHRAWSKKIHLSELILKSIQTKKLTSGFCEKITLIPELKKQKRLHLFSNSKCKTSEDLILGIEPQELNEKNLKQDLELSQKLNLRSGDVSKTEEENPDQKWSHLPAWLLVGAGIIILSLLLSLGGGNNKKPDEEYIY